MTCGPCPPLLLLRLEKIRDTPELATVHVGNTCVACYCVISENAVPYMCKCV